MGGGDEGAEGLHPEHDGEGTQQCAQRYQAHGQGQVSVQYCREVGGGRIS